MIEVINAMDLRIEHWPIDQLIPYIRNPRTHTREQVAQVAGSIAEFGFVNPILVGPDNVIVAGHARFGCWPSMRRNLLPRPAKSARCLKRRVAMPILARL